MRFRPSTMASGLAVGVTLAVALACGLASYLYSRHHYAALLDSARVTALAPAADEPASPPPGNDVFYTGNFTIQVGAFENPDNAARLRSQLDRQFINAHVTRGEVDGKTFHRVRVGRSTSLDVAESQRQSLSSRGFPEAFVVAE